MEELIIVSPKTIKAIIITALEEFNSTQNEKSRLNRLFSINKAAKIAMKSKSQLIEEQHFNLALQEIIEAELAKGRSHV